VTRRNGIDELVMKLIFPDKRSRCLGKRKGPLLSAGQFPLGVTMPLPGVLSEAVAYLHASRPVTDSQGFLG
jgi:hypothetical protein